MATKGYLRKADNAHLLSRNLKRFRRTGVPLSEVTVGGDITRVIDSLECGDCLVVLSVAELSLQTTRQKILLKRIVEKGITLRPLDKINAESRIEEESLFDRLLRSFGLKKHPVQKEEIVAPDSQMNEQMQIRVIPCLKPYYQLKKGVEPICDNAGINPKALYQFLRENDLPSRREVRVQPEINPLRKPGFPDSLLGTRTTEEKTKQQQANKPINYHKLQ